MPSIQNLTMTFDDERKSFAEGDTLTGKVTLALSKATTVESLYVKVKGDVNVCWTKKSGDRNHTYSAHRRIFKEKVFLIAEDSKETIVPKGVHVYNFHFNIPQGSLPSSFRGPHGQIIYKLEVKLSRSWRMDRTIQKEIHFVSKSHPNLQSLITARQVGSTNKEMGLFSKGSVHMEAIVDRKAYAPGESIAIVAKVNNSSSSDMTPKFSFNREIVYRANGHTKSESCIIDKVVEHCIKPKTERTVKCAIKIAPDQIESIQNCDILSVEYYVKVYLDISFSFDPTVVFPVLVFPRDLAHSFQHDVAAGSYPAGSIRGPSNSDFPPHAVPMGPYPVGAYGGPSKSNFPPHAVPMGPYLGGAVWGPSNSDFPPLPASMGPYPASSSQSGRYGHPGSRSNSDLPPEYPALPVSGGFSNPAQQLASPYGSPFSSRPSVLHPPPPAPTPSAPAIQPPPFSPPSNISPSAPTYNLLPSAPDLNTDFLSQLDEAPPSYSILFPPSAPESNDSKL